MTKRRNLNFVKKVLLVRVSEGSGVEKDPFKLTDYIVDGEQIIGTLIPPQEKEGE